MKIIKFVLARIAEDEALARSLSHIPAWGSRRILAECAAKRKIVERALWFYRIDDQNEAEAVRDIEYHEHILPALASIWSDHPDYREEWNP